ncbi:MAG: hypothetical protein AAF512_10360, partial [Pseudomonadota bacterium]
LGYTETQTFKYDAGNCTANLQDCGEKALALQGAAQNKALHACRNKSQKCLIKALKAAIQKKEKKLKKCNNEFKKAIKKCENEEDEGEVDGCALNALTVVQRCEKEPD